MLAVNPTTGARAEQGTSPTADDDPSRIIWPEGWPRGARRCNGYRIEQRTGRNKPQYGLTEVCGRAKWLHRLELGTSPLLSQGWRGPVPIPVPMLRHTYRRSRTRAASGHSQRGPSWIETSPPEPRSCPPRPKCSLWLPLTWSKFPSLHANPKALVEWSVCLRRRGRPSPTITKHSRGIRLVTCRR